MRFTSPHAPLNASPVFSTTLWKGRRGERKSRKQKALSIEKACRELKRLPLAAVLDLFYLFSQIIPRPIAKKYLLISGLGTFWVRRVVWVLSPPACTDWPKAAPRGGKGRTKKDQIWESKQRHLLPLSLSPSSSSSFVPGGGK